jgi:hypothetical protein
MRAISIDIDGRFILQIDIMIDRDINYHDRAYLLLRARQYVLFALREQAARDCLNQTKNQRIRGAPGGAITPKHDSTFWVFDKLTDQKHAERIVQAFQGTRLLVIDL